MHFQGARPAIGRYGFPRTFAMRCSRRARHRPEMAGQFGRPGRNNLAGIQDPVGIEQPLDFSENVQQRSVLRGKEWSTTEPVAMFATQ